jgi:hypothetical protein
MRRAGRFPSYVTNGEREAVRLRTSGDLKVTRTKAACEFH